MDRLRGILSMTAMGVFAGITFAIVMIPGSSTFAVTPVAATTGPRVFLHLVCDGGIDPSMVFEWKGGGSNSYAVEPGSTARVATSGLPHVSNPSRPAVDSFFDTHGMRVAILNGVNAPDLGPRALRGPALEFSPSASTSRNWLASYVEDVGKGRPVPILVFPGISLDGAVTEMNLAGRVPASLMSTAPQVSPFPPAVRERIFRDLRVDFTSFASRFRSGGGDHARSRGMDKQFRMHQVLEGVVPESWTAVYDSSRPDFVNQSKLALELFKSGRSLGAIVRVGGAGAWSPGSAHFASQSVAIQGLFDGLNSILAHAYANGLQSRLVIVVSGQYGRTPWLNASGGKDPWPVSSMMFWGNGIRSKVTGSFDDVGRGVRIDPRFGTTTGSVISLTFENAYASMLFLGGTNWKKWTSAVPVSGLLEGQ